MAMHTATRTHAHTHARTHLDARRASRGEHLRFFLVECDRVRGLALRARVIKVHAAVVPARRKHERPDGRPCHLVKRPRRRHHLHQVLVLEAVVQVHAAVVTASEHEVAMEGRALKPVHRAGVLRVIGVLDGAAQLDALIGSRALGKLLERRIVHVHVALRAARRCTHAGPRRHRCCACAACRAALPRPDRGLGAGLPSREAPAWQTTGQQRTLTTLTGGSPRCEDAHHTERTLTTLRGRTPQSTGCTKASTAASTLGERRATGAHLKHAPALGANHKRGQPADGALRGIHLEVHARAAVHNLGGRAGLRPQQAVTVYRHRQLVPLPHHHEPVGAKRHQPVRARLVAVFFVLAHAVLPFDRHQRLTVAQVR
eukprot:366417-Chlamydomonas_euryale.AAC.6